MDRVAQEREIIKTILRGVAAYCTPNENIKMETVFDDESGHYLVFRTGWRDHRRIHGSVVHIALREDKVWVEHEGTDLEIVDQLLEAGIPAERIVLGFHPPSQRKYTEFAIA